MQHQCHLDIYRDDDGGRCGLAADNTNSTAYRLQQLTQAEAARFQLYMDIVTNVPGFVVLLFFGKLIFQFPLYLGHHLRSLLGHLQAFL